jgi:hypothetical protein
MLVFYINNQKEFCMKNLCKLTGNLTRARSAKVPLVIIALTAVMVFSMIACDNELDPGADAPQSVTYVSQDSDGNFYTLVVTEKTNRSVRYTARDGDSFTFTVELFNNGKYSAALTFSGTIESAEDDGTEIEIKITVNGKPLTITIEGTEMTVISGTIVLDNKEERTIAGPLTPANAPEDWPDAKRWYHWVNDDSTATLDYSVSDDVFTVTVGGTAQPNDETDDWGRWKAGVGYVYTAVTNKRYKYTFEAWTQSGTRTLSGNCYHDWAGDGTSIGYADFTINTVRKTYTIYGGKIPKGGVRGIGFHCADQLGTFYVKILEIKEYEIEELDNVPPEERPFDARWSKLVENDCTATLDYSPTYTANDGTGRLMCTITVGGRADPTEWKARAQYSYTAKANTSYIYGFHAWTQSGTRTVTIESYNDWGNGGDNISLTHNITITTQKQWFSFEGEPIPKDRVCQMAFLCANKTGTFYVEGLRVGDYW